MTSSAPTLFEACETIGDRRGRKGRQFALASLLVVALAAMLAGSSDVISIFRWVRRLPTDALRALGLARAPCHATFHYFFRSLDVAAVERALGAFLGRAGAVGHVAIDGKRLRGSAPAGHDGHEGVHLVSAFATEIGAVLDQVKVGLEGGEIAAAMEILKRMPLAGQIITGDALFCQRDICQAIVDGGGDYVLTVKANQATLMSDIAVAFGDRFPP